MEEERELVKEMRIEWVNCQGNLVNISLGIFIMFSISTHLWLHVLLFFFL